MTCYVFFCFKLETISTSTSSCDLIDFKGINQLISICLKCYSIRAFILWFYKYCACIICALCINWILGLEYCSIL